MLELMIAAPASGSGKTVLTCALLAALKERGLSPCAFKCGPDYALRQAAIFVKVDRLYFGKVNVTLLIPVDQLFICADG